VTLLDASLIHVEGLRVSFASNIVVDDVNLSVDAGKCLALVGESGSGKTISSRSLLGMVPPGGRVEVKRLEIEGVDMAHASEQQWQRLRGRSIGLIAQDALVSLDPLRPIGREVAEALRVHAKEDNVHTRLTRKQIRVKVLDELNRVALPNPEQRLRQYAHELSGGLRQRALIASATIMRPSLLIADEPTSALDVSVQAQILQLLSELKNDGMGLLLISHDLTVVSHIADHIAVMREGHIVEEGSVAEIFQQAAHPYTQKLLAATPALHAPGTRLSTQPALRLAPCLSHLACSEERTGEIASRINPILSVQGVSQSFRQADGKRLKAVDQVSFEVTAGETLGIVGESGSGKTTLGRIILGLQRPDEGCVLLDGEAWSQLSHRQRREKRHLIQAVYQDPLSSFDPRWSVEAILGEAVALNGIPRQQRKARIMELATHLGLEPSLLKREAKKLSGGQRQRVAVARALARDPELLVCDEPVSALDVSVQAQVLDLFSDLKKQGGLTMIFISHDLGVIHHIADKILVMHEGAIVERGTAEQVFQTPQHPYTKSLLAALPTASISLKKEYLT
jgi:peptide/nickel transport system ATP-binding protein